MSRDKKAEKYLKLVGASIVKPLARSRLVSVALRNDGGSRRAVFPNSQFEEHADGTLYASAWIVGKINDELKEAGVPDPILTSEGFYL